MLQDLVDQLNRQLPDRCTALYIIGSIALGDFIPGQSDVDLLALLNGPAAVDEFAEIRKIHANIKKRYPNWQCEIMYFQPGDLGRKSEEIQPSPRYLLGKLTWMDYFPLSAVTWWNLRQNGITLFGPSAQTLRYSLNLDDLLRRQRQNLNSYWASWTQHPMRVLKLLSDWGIQWAVLGVMRLVYTLREHQITSKTGAGQYALKTFPERWHPVVREALLLRNGSGSRVYRSRIRRALDAYAFLKFAIQTGNQAT